MHLHEPDTTTELVTAYHSEFARLIADVTADEFPYTLTPLVYGHKDNTGNLWQLGFRLTYQPPANALHGLEIAFEPWQFLKGHNENGLNAYGKMLALIARGRLLSRLNDAL